VGGRSRLSRRPGRLGRLAAALAVGLVLAPVGPAAAQPAPSQPKYLAYLEFAGSDPAEIVTLKRAYNDAVAKYNRALYEYWVTLERVNRLVDLHAASSDPAVKKKARDEAEPLRAKLTVLGREVRSLASGVDEAARRATSGGVPVTR
jgi:hypothetical protein